MGSYKYSGTKVSTPFNSSTPALHSVVLETHAHSTILTERGCQHADIHIVSVSASYMSFT